MRSRVSLYFVADRVRVFAHCTSSFTVSIACSGTGGVGLPDLLAADRGQHGGDGAKTTVTMSAASHVAMARSRTAMRVAVSAPSGQQADERGGAEHPGALAGLLALLGHLGLGQVDLLTDQRAGLGRQLLDQLADRLLARIGRVPVGAHTPYPPSVGVVVLTSVGVVVPTSVRGVVLGTG